jgi:Cof subfamily protein (haloacid dehalogenase superfamily)
VKTVFITDMDGTLLDDNSRIPARNLSAIRQFVECGGEFTVASGRSPNAIFMYRELLPLLTLPVIACNGACVYDLHSGRTLRETALPDDIVSIAQLLLAQHPTFGCMVFQGNGDCIYSVRRDSYTDDVVLRREKAPLRLGELGDIPAPWIKLVFSSVDSAEIAGCARWLHDHAPGVNAMVTEQVFLEILPAGISKGVAVENLSRLSGFPLSQFMAIGDSTNDLTMLQRCGTGITVANADPAILAAVSRVCRSNNDCGVADCIRRYALPALLAR